MKEQWENSCRICRNFHLWVSLNASYLKQFIVITVDGIRGQPITISGQNWVIVVSRSNNIIKINLLHMIKIELLHQIPQSKVKGKI